MITWARPLGYVPPNPLHRIASEDGDSVVTFCHGSFDKRDGYERVTGPRPDDFCARCEALAGAR